MTLSTRFEKLYEPFSHQPLAEMKNEDFPENLQELGRVVYCHLRSWCTVHFQTTWCSTQGKADGQTAICHQNLSCWRTDEQSPSLNGDNSSTDDEGSRFCKLGVLPGVVQMFESRRCYSWNDLILYLPMMPLILVSRRALPKHWKGTFGTNHLQFSVIL